MRPNSYHWNAPFYLQDGKVVGFFYSFSFFSGGYRYQFMHIVCTEPSVQEQITTLDSRLYALGNYVIAARIPPNRKYTSLQVLLPTSAALHFPFKLLKKICICYANRTTNVTSWVMVMQYIVPKRIFVLTLYLPWLIKKKINRNVALIFLVTLGNSYNATLATCCKFTSVNFFLAWRRYVFSSPVSF